MGVYVKCDGLGEEAVMSHGQVRGTTAALLMVKARITHYYFTQDISRTARHALVGQAWQTFSKQALLSNHPNQILHQDTRYQTLLPPRTATRSSQLLGASRPLGDTDILYSLRPPAAYSCPCVHSSAPFGVLLTTFPFHET